MGLIQVLEPEARDHVLWTEPLEWIVSRTDSPDLDAPLPLVTFGPASSYRSPMFDTLDAAGIDHYVAFESESSAAVCSAVAAGFGVAIINERSRSGQCAMWDVPGASAALPDVSFVIRVNSRSRTTAVRTLVDDIRTSLR